MPDETLKIFLDGLEEIVFIESFNSVTGKVEKFTPEVTDMEAVIKIQGEWDREDLRDLLDTITTINEQETRTDERQRVLAEVEGWLVDEKSKKYTEKQWCKCGSLPNDDGYCEDCRRKVMYKDIYMEDEADTVCNKFRAELRAKLAELKGEE